MPRCNEIKYKSEIKHEYISELADEGKVLQIIIPLQKIWLLEEMKI